jgi:hypothetical protein
MAERPAAKKPATKKAASKKAAAPKKEPAKKAAAPAKAAKEKPARRDRSEPGERGPRRAAARRDPSLGPVQRTRVVIPMAFYEPNKDAIKAPLKEHGMKWTFLGEGKGLYKREKDIHCFTQFKDDGVHYSLWGDDKQGVSEVLAAWRALAGDALWAAWTSAGESAQQAEQQEKESEAMRLWKLGEPQRRPGEPDFFFQKRVAEWKAKRPA